MDKRKAFISETMAKLAAMTPYERAQVLADLENKKDGPLDKTVYDCPECRNRGYFLEPQPGGECKTLLCRCGFIRQSVQAARNSGMDELLRRCSFDNYRTAAPWMDELKKTAWSWATQKTGAWMLLCGQSGCGKTHLASAACAYRIFVNYERVKFLAWREFSDDQYRGGNTELQEQYLNAQLLYIDDLLKQDESRKASLPWETELAFKLLNYRANKGLPTAITTELTPDRLFRTDEATASRILDLAHGYIYTVNKDRNKNYRIRKRSS